MLFTKAVGRAMRRKRCRIGIASFSVLVVIATVLTMMALRPERDEYEPVRLGVQDSVGAIEYQYDGEWTVDGNVFFVEPDLVLTTFRLFDNTLPIRVRSSSGATADIESVCFWDARDDLVILRLSEPIGEATGFVTRAGPSFTDETIKDQRFARIKHNGSWAASGWEVLRRKDRGVRAVLECSTWMQEGPDQGAIVVQQHDGLIVGMVTQVEEVDGDLLLQVVPVDRMLIAVADAGEGESVRRVRSDTYKEPLVLAQRSWRLARNARSRGEHESAIKHAKDAIGHQARHPEAYLHLGLAQIKLGDTENGLASLKRAVQFSGGYSAFVELLLEEAVEAGDCDMARYAWNYECSRDWQTPRARLELLRCVVMSGKLSAVNTDLEDALQGIESLTTDTQTGDDAEQLGQILIALAQRSCDESTNITGCVGTLGDAVRGGFGPEPQEIVRGALAYLEPKEASDENDEPGCDTLTRLRSLLD